MQFLTRHCTTTTTCVKDPRQIRRSMTIEARRRDDGSNVGGADKLFKNEKFTILKNDFDNDKSN